MEFHFSKDVGEEGGVHHWHKVIFVVLLLTSWSSALNIKHEIPWGCGGQGISVLP